MQFNFLVLGDLSSSFVFSITSPLKTFVTSIYCVCIYSGGGHKHHRVHVEGRGQFVRVRSLLHLENLIQVTRLGGRHL